MKYQDLIVFHGDFSSFVPLLFTVRHCYFGVTTYTTRDASGIKVPVQGVNYEELIHNNSSCRQEVHIPHRDRYSRVCNVS